MLLRPTKEQAINSALRLTPQYAEWIIDLQKSKNQNFFDREIANIQNNLGNYVLMYDDERKIGRALFLALLGDEGFKEFNSEIESLSPKEQQEWLDEIASNDGKEFIEAFSEIEIPSTPEEWETARAENAKLPEVERNLLAKRGTYFWCFIFTSFFNTLSLMVHGARLTSLVPQAIAGDDEAFLKAIQIDRLLLIHHPYFRGRKFRAQDEADKEFLTKIFYREANPILRTKIRYPALYMLFGVLDTFRWLDDLKHKEILNICDDAGLDRYQNRIEDVGYLTKRLTEYRDLQKTGGMSTHSN